MLEPQVVVYGNSDLLLRPNISLRGLDRRVPQQELDLFEIATSLPAQLGAGPSQIVNSEALAGCFAPSSTSTPTPSLTNVAEEIAGEETLLAPIDGLRDEKLTGFTLCLALTSNWK